MSNLIIDTIEARLEGITPGVWSVGNSYGAIVSTERMPEDHPNHPAWVVPSDEDGSPFQMQPCSDELYGGVLIAESIKPHNSQFLAHSKHDVQVLLKVVQTLRGMLDTQMSEALVDQIITEAAQSA
jgi:hypothetical protein